MLKGLDPILGPDLLAVLRAMGHGDEIALVDGNYPAETDARKLVRADGHGVIAILNAILSIMPIDEFVPESIFRAVNAKTPDKPDPIHSAMEACCSKWEPEQKVVPLAPAAFYQRVKDAKVIVATSEPSLYANIILRKGIIRPAA